MRKITLSVLLLLLWAGHSSTETVIHTGVLGYLGTTEDAFQEGFDRFCMNISYDKYIENGTSSAEFIKSLSTERRIIRFHDNLMSMLMEIKTGKVDEIMLPDFTGHYIIRSNSSYEVKYNSGILSSGISFAFLKGREELKAEFDAAITAMKEDGTIAALAGKYVLASMDRDPKPLRPETFNGAETITVAVTGDMPPIDMFAGDGQPAGYNTAILSEIGRRLGKNIQMINISTGGRSSALSSGRADVVFWYRTTESVLDDGDSEADPIESLFLDAPEGVILSLPYYSWNKEVIIMKTEGKGLFGW